MSGQEDLQKWLKQLKSRAGAPRKASMSPPPEPAPRHSAHTEQSPVTLQDMLQEVFQTAGEAQRRTTEHRRRKVAEKDRREEERQREEAERRNYERERKEKAAAAKKRLEEETARREEEIQREVRARKAAARGRPRKSALMRKQRATDAREAKEQSGALHKNLIKGPASLRRAIILAEILGPPKSMRRF